MPGDCRPLIAFIRGSFCRVHFNIEFVIPACFLANPSRTRSLVVEGVSEILWKIAPLTATESAAKKFSILVLRARFNPSDDFTFGGAIKSFLQNSRNPTAAPFEPFKSTYFL